MKLYNKPAHELHEMLAKKEISSVELTKDVFARMDDARGCEEKANTKSPGLHSPLFKWKTE